MQSEYRRPLLDVTDRLAPGGTHCDQSLNLSALPTGQARIHVAFVKPPVREKILAGTKTCESRLSVYPHPARNARPGDLLIFKCGDGFATADIGQVDIHAALAPTDIDLLRDLYATSVGGNNPNLAYWDAKRRSHHAVFLHFENVRPLTIPRRLLPNGVMLGWVSNYPPPDDLAEMLGIADDPRFHRSSTGSNPNPLQASLSFGE